MPAGIDTFGFEDLEVRVYDPATKTILKRFKSYKRAGYELGLSSDVVRDACLAKKRKYSPALDQEVALRLMNKNK
jgi:hypothetical protein